MRAFYVKISTMFQTNFSTDLLTMENCNARIGPLNGASQTVQDMAIQCGAWHVCIVRVFIVNCFK